MKDCIFCRIISGELKGEIIHRDDSVIAFKDINPKAPVHVLVVPKTHVSSLMEAGAIEGNLLNSVYRAVQILVPKLGLENGFRVVSNYGEDGGQSVDHIHFHVLGKRRMTWPPG